MCCCHREPLQQQPLPGTIPHPPSPPWGHTKITQMFPRTGSCVRPCPGVAMRVFLHPRRSLGTGAGAAVSVSLTGSDESLQTTDMPGAPRTHSVYFASLLLSCSAQSVSGVSEKSEKENPLNQLAEILCRSSWGLPSKMSSLWFPRLPAK